jgi:hypothetical protein
MPEINTPSCPLHGSLPRALHSENFEGIVTVIDELLLTVSGVVGTTTYTRCPYGYPYNFEGVVRALEDLNASMSGIQGGGGGGGSSVVAGSGIYLTPSGAYDIIQVDYGVVASGALVAGTNIDFTYLSDGRLEINSLAQISGVQSAVYVQDTAPPESTGALWFDTAEGRLFVYDTAGQWSQTNAEALVLKSEIPPSGAGLNAPPRDGSLWFNTLMGNLFVYDATSSGWYETGSTRTFAYSSTAPAPSVPGAGWFNSDSEQIKVWNGSEWADITISGGTI